MEWIITILKRFLVLYFHTNLNYLHFIFGFQIKNFTFFLFTCYFSIIYILNGMDYHHIEQISGIVFSYKPKEDQLKAVYSYYMDMKDTIMIAPTGFGKSYIYQIAPFLYDHSRYIRHAFATIK